MLIEIIKCDTIHIVELWTNVTERVVSWASLMGIVENDAYSVVDEKNNILQNCKL